MNTTTKIIAKKDLYNGGLCFTKGREYFVTGYIENTYQLMQKMTTNDQGEGHIIGNFHKHFKIVK